MRLPSDIATLIVDFISPIRWREKWRCPIWWEGGLKGGFLTPVVQCLRDIEL